jgi:predicted nucleic acid-binding Zn ribbon protein
MSFTKMREPNRDAGFATHEPRLLGELIKEFASQDGISEKLRSYEVVGDWEKIVGNTIERNTEIIRIENGTLYVQAKNSAWRNELIFAKPAILRKIKENYPASGVEDIFFI